MIYSVCVCVHCLADVTRSIFPHQASHCKLQPVFCFNYEYWKKMNFYCVPHCGTIESFIVAFQYQWVGFVIRRQCTEYSTFMFFVP